MRVLVLSGYGINCEDETLNAFKTVGISGAIIHVNDLIENPKKLKNFQIFITYRTIIRKNTSNHSQLILHLILRSGYPVIFQWGLETLFSDLWKTMNGMKFYNHSITKYFTEQARFVQKWYVR